MPPKGRLGVQKKGVGVPCPEAGAETAMRFRECAKKRGEVEEKSWFLGSKRANKNFAGKRGRDWRQTARIMAVRENAISCCESKDWQKVGPVGSRRKML